MVRSATVSSRPPSCTLLLPTCFEFPNFPGAQTICVYLWSSFLGTLCVLFALSLSIPTVVMLCSLENSPFGLAHWAEG